MYIHVRVTAGAKREYLTAIDDEYIHISVREPAQRNLANRRVATLVGEHFGVSPKMVRLVAGHRSPKKVFAIGD